LNKERVKYKKTLVRAICYEVPFNVCMQLPLKNL